MSQKPPAKDNPNVPQEPKDPFALSADVFHSSLQRLTTATTATTVFEEGHDCVFLLRAGGEGVHGTEALSTHVTVELNVGDVIVDRSDVTFNSLDLASWAVRWDEAPSRELFLLPSVQVRAHTQLEHTLNSHEHALSVLPCEIPVLAF